MIGIDIGSNSLKLAQVGKRGVERLAVEPLPENMVQDGRIISFDAMGTFIKESLHKNRMTGKCAIVLPTGVAFLRRITLPLMSIDQLAVNLPFEFKDYLEQEKERFIFDYAVISIKEAEGDFLGSMDLLAVAAAKEVVENYRTMFRRVGLVLEVVAPRECAFSNLLREAEGINSEQEKDTYCIADLGHSATHLYLFNNATFDTVRAIDIGNIDIDYAIANEQSIDEFIARKHKESNMNNALDFEVVKDIYENISLEVMKSINYYGFNNPDADLKNIYFCGGGSAIPQLVSAVGSASQMDPSKITDILPALPPQDSALAPVCVAAIGIACQ